MANSMVVRCYCHGLGDCMLLNLSGDEAKPFWILIDCGIHSAAAGGSATMRAVVADIVKTTNGRIDVLVGTHEHWDHLSGFTQASDLFSQVKVGEVWFSWAENPADPAARSLDRFKSDASAALAGVSLRLANVGAMSDIAHGIDGLLGFVFGAKGEKVRDAREQLRGLGHGNVRHLEPGSMAPLDEALGVRCYVLGPPRDPKLLGIEDIVSETYAFGGAAPSVMPLANGLSLNEGGLSIDDDAGAPFDGSVGAPLSKLLQGDWGSAGESAGFFWRHYLGPETPSDGPLDQDWRRIDNDWLAGGAEMALQLDGRTNNSSLVLAFEIIDTGRVLLFAADAQVGNWMSWADVAFPAAAGAPPGATGVSSDDLLRRTVFYKVGHHGSRNATLASALEKMDRSRLVAFSPTDESLAARIGWNDFPAPKTSQRLRELTNGRFIQSDAPWLKDASMEPPIARGGALVDYTVGPEGLYVDLTIG